MKVEKYIRRGHPRLTINEIKKDKILDGFFKNRAINLGTTVDDAVESWENGLLHQGCITLRNGEYEEDGNILPLTEETSQALLSEYEEYRIETKGHWEEI